LKRKILITGSSGYIGSNLFKNLKNLKYDIIVVKRLELGKFKYLSLNKNEFNLNNFGDSEITLIHLATLFSKEKRNNKEMVYANEIFGKEVIDNLLNFNLKKVIYTNTMFQYYPDRETRLLPYTQTKENFSQTLKKKSKQNTFFVDEIYLDNTYGNQDLRPKVIPQIIEAIHLQTNNPILNKNSFINLVHVNEVVKRLLLSIDSNKNDTSCFVSNFSYNLSSIYNFLNDFNLKGEYLTKKIDNKNNEYLKNHPPIDLKNIQLRNLEKSLIEEYKTYGN